MIEFMTAVSWQFVGLVLTVCGAGTAWYIVNSIKQASRYKENVRHDERMAEMRISDQKALTRSGE